MLLEQAEMQSKYESEIKNQGQRSDNQQAEIQGKLSEVQTQLNQVLELKRDLESEVKDLKQNLERKTYEHQMAQNETVQLRQGNQALDQTKYSQEKSITEQIMLIQSLKREVKDKETLIEKSQK